MQIVYISNRPEILRGTLAYIVAFIFTPVRFIEACRRRYGDLVTLRTLMDPGFVMVFEPELVKQVFRYAFGRVEATPDDNTLGAAGAAFAKNDYVTRDLLLGLATSRGFRYRALPK